MSCNLTSSLRVTFIRAGRSSLLWALVSAKIGAGADLAGEFQISRLEGKIFALRYSEASWIALEKGQSLPVETLIQTDGAGVISLLRTGKGPDDRKEVNLVFNGAAMIRLTENLVRDLHIKDVVIDATRAGLPPIIAGRKKETLTRALGSAFERSWGLSAVVATSNPISTRFFMKESPKGLSLEIPAVSIKIKFPVNGTLILTDRFPMELPLSWASIDPASTIGRTKADQQVLYKVLGWPLGQKSESILDETTGLNSILDISGPGKYLLQIIANTPSSSSEAVMITVEDSQGR